MANQPETPQPSPTFELHAIAMNRALFEHLPRVTPEPGEEKPAQMNYNLVLGAAVKYLANGRHEVSLGVTVTPDPKWMPYKIEVEMLGLFSVAAGSEEDLKQFTRLAAPTILFPYLREVVSKLTADGKHGVVRLNPINVQAMLANSDWVDVPMTASSEPSQPSEQSPYALPE